MPTQQYPEHILKQADEMANDAFNAMCDCMNANGATLDFRIIRDTLNLPALLMAKEENELLKQDLQDAATTFSVPIEELVPGSNGAKLLITGRLLKQELSQHQQVVKQLVEALDDIHLTAHCISKSGPATTPTLQDAWHKFDIIAVKATGAKATAKQLLEKKV